ncbi:MAG TPA: Rrf2 family transcriptional regulator [Phycisphaerales bacterium]|nr:Rrf2 family transcriptional regulator [Phycisphaerales bacterium]
MFSQTAEYALRAMICLATLEREGAAAASSERISHLTGIPSGYLSKIMRSLVVGGLVGSQRGPHGGFSLARPARAITLLDVVRAVSADHGVESAPGDNGVGPESPLGQRLRQLTLALQESLRAATIEQVLGEVRQRGGDAA